MTQSHSHALFKTWQLLRLLLLSHFQFLVPPYATGTMVVNAVVDDTVSPAVADVFDLLRRRQLEAFGDEGEALQTEIILTNASNFGVSRSHLRTVMANLNLVLLDRVTMHQFASILNACWYYTQQQNKGPAGSSDAEVEKSPARSASSGSPHVHRPNSSTESSQKQQGHTMNVPVELYRGQSRGGSANPHHRPRPPPIQQPTEFICSDQPFSASFDYSKERTPRSTALASAVVHNTATDYYDLCAQLGKLSTEDRDRLVGEKLTVLGEDVYVGGINKLAELLVRSIDTASPSAHPTRPTQQQVHHYSVRPPLSNSTPPKRRSSAKLRTGEPVAPRHVKNSASRAAPSATPATTHPPQSNRPLQRPFSGSTNRSLPLTSSHAGIAVSSSRASPYAAEQTLVVLVPKPIRPSSSKTSASHPSRISKLRAAANDPSIAAAAKSKQYNREEGRMGDCCEELLDAAVPVPKIRSEHTRLIRMYHVDPGLAAIITVQLFLRTHVSRRVVRAAAATRVLQRVGRGYLRARRGLRQLGGDAKPVVFSMRDLMGSRKGGLANSQEAYLNGCSYKVPPPVCRQEITSDGDEFDDGVERADGRGSHYQPSASSSPPQHPDQVHQHQHQRSQHKDRVANLLPLKSQRRVTKERAALILHRFFLRCAAVWKKRRLLARCNEWRNRAVVEEHVTLFQTFLQNVKTRRVVVSKLRRRLIESAGRLLTRQFIILRAKLELRMRKMYVREQVEQRVDEER